MNLTDAARIPAPGDNVAIATSRLAAGTRIGTGSDSYPLSHTVLEGHRFAVQPISPGQPLLSWGLPFGLATTPIHPGDYVCNDMMLAALKVRHVDFPLPVTPNFVDHAVDYRLDEESFVPGQQVPPHPQPGTFRGFPRATSRGAGTRNYIAVLGTTSLTGAYARTLAERCQQLQAPNLDGIVAVAHTEGGGAVRPNNLELTLRTLAGFIVHPNIGAILIVDWGSEPITNELLRQYMIEHHYPLSDLPHRFMSLKGTNYQAALNDGEKTIRSWLEPISVQPRVRLPLSGIRIGLQCGGSDAFSGVSGNPLAGWLAREMVRHGGSANLAETPELIGAEPYVLHNVRDLTTARRFLQELAHFQEWAGWHGHSAAGNPSGGNLYRGLYNIIIKSIGAARKKDPAQRLDYVIDFADPMTAPGFYFMNSPGNDLESIAGQVGSGCNIILFVTGNGSITNFPFVPTIKIVTTTGRYELLQNEMDVNAGRYLDGVPLDTLGAETFEDMLAILSGRRSVGEKAGHSQVQLWREWRQTGPVALPTRIKPSGKPLLLKHPPAPNPAPSRSASGSPEALPPEPLTYPAFKTAQGITTDQIGLILPTSLCSSQVARMIVERLNRTPLPGITRCVALPHTEGCGVSRGESEQLYMRTMTGYLCHPFVRRALLLEHGCEKTHNDEMHGFLAEHQIDSSHFGWASVQMDGGIDAVAAKVMAWFEQSLQNQPSASPHTAELGSLRLGLIADGAVPPITAQAMATVIARIIKAGGIIVVPQNSSLLANEAFTSNFPGLAPERITLQNAVSSPTLAYGQHAFLAGFHIMETPTDHQGEILTGLGATGVEVILAHVTDHYLPAHPMIPVLQVGLQGTGLQGTGSDLDFAIAREQREVLAATLLELVLRTAARDYRPKLFLQGHTDFQVTRGLVGVSL